jgi:hypothetical protein
VTPAAADAIRGPGDAPKICEAGFPPESCEADNLHGVENNGRHSSTQFMPGFGQQQSDWGSKMRSGSPMKNLVVYLLTGTSSSIKLLQSLVWHLNFVFK